MGRRSELKRLRLQQALVLRTIAVERAVGGTFAAQRIGAAHRAGVTERPHVLEHNPQQREHHPRGTQVGSARHRRPRAHNSNKRKPEGKDGHFEDDIGERERPRALNTARQRRVVVPRNDGSDARAVQQYEENGGRAKRRRGGHAARLRKVRVCDDAREQRDGNAEAVERDEYPPARRRRTRLGERPGEALEHERRLNIALNVDRRVHKEREHSSQRDYRHGVKRRPAEPRQVEHVGRHEDKDVQRNEHDGNLVAHVRKRHTPLPSALQPTRKHRRRLGQPGNDSECNTQGGHGGRKAVRSALRDGIGAAVPGCQQTEDGLARRKHDRGRRRRLVDPHGGRPHEGGGEDKVRGEHGPLPRAQPRDDGQEGARDEEEEHERDPRVVPRVRLKVGVATEAKGCPCGRRRARKPRVKLNRGGGVRQRQRDGLFALALVERGLTDAHLRTERRRRNPKAGRAHAIGIKARACRRRKHLEHARMRAHKHRTARKLHAGPHGHVEGQRVRAARDRHVRRGEGRVHSAHAERVVAVGKIEGQRRVRRPRERSECDWLLVDICRLPMYSALI
eukprot:Opistho-1_new@10705